MRNISEVAARMSAVIPKEESRLKRKVDQIVRAAMYIAPEQAAPYWDRLAAVVNEAVPQNRSALKLWQQRFVAIFENKEAKVQHA